MPYMRRKKTRTYRPRVSYRKRNFRRRRMYRTARKKFTGNAMRPTVMPLKYKFSTRYVDTYKTIGSPAGSVALYLYCANGLFDPDISGTGHQPIGFDQIMGFYDHYTVIASKIKVTFQNLSDEQPIIVAVSLSDDAAAGTSNIGTVIENGSAKWRRLERQGTDASFQNNVRSTCTLTKSVSVKRFMGRPNILSEDDLRGNVASNPMERLFFKLWAQGIDGSAVAMSCSFTVQIDYVAILTEPKLVQAS